MAIFILVFSRVRVVCVNCLRVCRYWMLPLTVLCETTCRCVVDEFVSLHAMFVLRETETETLIIAKLMLSICWKLHKLAMFTTKATTSQSVTHTCICTQASACEASNKLKYSNLHCVSWSINTNMSHYVLTQEIALNENLFFPIT